MVFLKKMFGDSTKRKNINIENIPAHIAIIMDGNGRWAKKRRIPRSAGHRAGSQTLKRIVEFCSDIGVKYLTVYAFSTENWKRPKDEVDSLMDLLVEYLKQAEKELSGKDTRIRVIGDREGLPSKVIKEIIDVEALTYNNKGMVLNIALNYGARSELVSAVKKVFDDIKNGKLTENDITEECISEKLYTAGIPDPDLLIRPSGEKRLSNFLLWQCAYTEFWYSDICWPDFTKDDLLDAISDYRSRSRRFGGV